MSRTKLVLSLILMGFLPALPIYGVSFVFLGRVGAVVCVVLFWSALWIIAACSEGSIARALGAASLAPQGLQNTLRIVTRGHSELNCIRMLVYPDPTPNALTVRGVFGKGTILLSQGLVATLNEEELRYVLRLSVQRLNDRGIRFQSFCSTVVVWALYFAPRAWVRLFFAGKPLTQVEETKLNPISGIGFLMVFPLVQLFLELSRPPKQEIDSIAMQKVSQAIQVWGPSNAADRHPGAFSLYFINPGSGQMLFPYD